LEIVDKHKFDLILKDNDELPAVYSEKDIVKSDEAQKVYIDTIDGKIKVTLPVGHKDTIRLPYRGLTYVTPQGMKRGAHYVKLNY
jgi:hypothetical protein